MRLSWVFAAVGLVAVGCGSSPAVKQQGGERQDCYPNGTCNAGLTCASNVCVSLSDGGAGSGGGTGGGGRGGSTGAAGAIGGAGASGTGGAAGSTAGAGGGASGTAGTGGNPACLTAANHGSLGSKTAPDALRDDTSTLLTWSLPLEAVTPGDTLDVQLFADLGVFAAQGGFVTGTFQLAGDELNYKTCGLCVLIYENVDANDLYRGVYLATSGTVTLTSVAGTLTGTLSNIKLQHVTISSTLVSTPHTDGCRSAIDSLSFNVSIVGP